jgi:hypothetical protein
MKSITTRTTLFICALIISGISPASAEEKLPYYSGKRDPFWPIGFIPNMPKEAPKKIEKRRLTEAELRALALAQQERLKRLLELDGSISKGGKRYILIGGNLVTTGDVLEIAVGGETYKLLVKSLSSDNIQLEPLTE